MKNLQQLQQIMKQVQQMQEQLRSNWMTWSWKPRRAAVWSP